MRRIGEYLQIPEDYEGNRYSLSWSAAGDAVERPDGSTFAFAAEVGLFLEGYASVGPLIHFSYILYLLQRFDARLAEPDEPGASRGGPGRELVQKSDALAIAFREAGRPLRNAGALCARLCGEVPPLPDPPDAAELCLRLSNGSLMSELTVRRWGTSPLGSEAESPPLGALAFEVGFLNALKRLSPEEVESWLRHGRPPLPDPGERVAQAVAALRPRTLAGVLATLVGRERLAGAVPMVGPLGAALVLPPRRLGSGSEPAGGYADIATRGRPEQILPSQFAIDDLEFLRRFAGNELLYFHREEPHAPVTEELVLLLDQGVRTWGRVRHALAASALALGKWAAGRGLSLRVATTGTEGRAVDPTEADPEALGALWEASDLTANPSLALERLLEGRAGAGRDVVVLSHPRSVAEPDFAAAARRASAGTRGFSLAIDEPGAVQFREWRRGGPVKLGDFRVDFAPPPAARGATPSPGGGDPRGWRGDVEPVGYPFRFGVVHRIERPLFDFDHAGRRLLLATGRGMLHAWELDGSRAEVLPRAMVEGEVLEQVDAVLGVADGFVVGGRSGRSLVAMHYDFAGRVGRAHVLGPAFDGHWGWFYSRPSHIVVARGRTYSRALDLATGEVSLSRESRARPSTRAIRAFEMAANHALPPPGLAVVDEGHPAPARGRSVRLDRGTGAVHLSGVSPPWDDFVPVSDGRPTLRGCWVEHAQWRGDVLALVVSGPDRKAALHLFGGPSGVPARELAPSSGDPGRFILSEDGRLIARRLGERQLGVREVGGGGQAIFVTAKGKTHPDPRVTLGRYAMVIEAGKHINLVRWDRGRLEVSTVGDDRAHLRAIFGAIDHPATGSVPRPALLDYDPRRFVACARAELTAVVDAFGQVALLDAGDRLVAMLIAFRGQVAAWLPDGTRLGPCHGPWPLIDGPATPDAAAIIGRALKAASDAGHRAGPT